MRIINHLIFVLTLAAGIAYIVLSQLLDILSESIYVNLSYLGLRSGHIFLAPLVIVGCLGVLFVQWLIAWSAWVVRHKKLEQAQNEVLRLKARLYDLTEGTWVDEIKDTIVEARRGIREDITWLASQPFYQTSAQLTEGQLKTRELPALPKQATEDADRK